MSARHVTPHPGFSAGSLVVTGLALLFCCYVAQAAEALPAALVKTIKHVSSVQGFSCTFEQVLTFSDASVQRYQGNLAVLRPKRFRWHYTQPYEQLYVGNGSRVWHYEPDLMQVRVLKDLQGVDPAVMRLLSGRIRLDSLLLLKQDAGSGRYQVRIQDGPEVWLGLSGDGLITYLETRDALGNRNRINLHDCNFQPPKDTLFVFKVPVGVDVISE